MKKPVIIIIVIGLIAILVVLGAVRLFTGKSTEKSASDTNGSSFPSDQPYYAQNPSGSGQVSKDEEEILLAFKNQVRGGSGMQVAQISSTDGYAIVVWVDEPAGGETLLKYDTSQARWSVMESTGGAFNVAHLHDAGIPQKTILVLLKGINDQ